MLDKNDKDFLKKSLDNTRQVIVKDVTDYLQEHVIRLFNEHEARLDRLEKTVGGFRPISD